MELRRRGQYVSDYNSYELLLHGEPLRPAQREHFDRCVNLIRDSGATMIYRGEKQSRIESQYGVPFIKRDTFAFDTRLFMLGQKGKYFHRGGHDQPGIQLVDQCNNMFEALFIMLHHLMENQFTGKKASQMDKFKSRELEVYSYFLDRGNVLTFLAAIEGLTTGEKMLIRDYYLGLLHNVDRSRFYSQSFLLSTSTRMSVAKGFAGIKKGRGYDNAIIFSGWVPEAFEGVLRAPDRGLLERMGNFKGSVLPFYKDLVFDNQAEVALKGGLLPHYLLGYHYWESGQIVMELNPALFDIPYGWKGEGLPIDQGDFDHVLGLTPYARCFSVEELSGRYQEGRMSAVLDGERSDL